MSEPKKTKLHGWHEAQGANMALFGNYHMPLWYKTGARAEHLAVITAAGIFDTSHMAAVSVRGPAARGLLQLCLSKDLNTCIGKDRLPLGDGRCVYGVFLNEDGTVLDDAIVYQLKPEVFMVVVNAGMGGPVAAHLDHYGLGKDVVVRDLTDRVGKMDIQGPQAARILAGVLREPEAVFDRMTYFSFKGGFGEKKSETVVTLTDGTPVLLSRTGYTGEFGFELFVEIDRLLPLWQLVLAAGQDRGLVACGLAARDSLRAGAVLPLSHQDIGAWPFLHNPWQFALSWNDDHTSFSKVFVGAPALLASNWRNHTLPFAGFDPRKIGAGEGNYVTTTAGERIGTILTCTTDMAIGRVDGEIASVAGNPGFQAKGLCCGFVLVDRHLRPGDQVVLTDGKRNITVEIRADIRPQRTARSPIGKMLG